jgi:Autotransporter beta-domain
MRKIYLVRGPGAVHIFAIGLATSWSTTAAFAFCGMASVGGGGSGPPSISATETSTTQVLEEVRRRTEAAKEQQPVPVSNAAPAPAEAPPPAASAPPPPAAAEPAKAASNASAAAATAAAQAAKPASANATPPPAPAAAKPAPKPDVAEAVEAVKPAPKVKAVEQAEDAVEEAAPKPKVAKQAESAAEDAVEQAPAKPAKKPKAVKKAKAAEPEPEPQPEKYSAHPPSLKDYGSSEDRSIVGGLSRTTAVWAQGFADYERHSNLAPGNQENPTRRSFTGGGLVGADWTQVKHGETVQALQFGVFSGYSASHTKFSDTSFKANDIAPNPGLATYLRTDNQQDVDGPFVGTYAAYIADKWTFDAAFKADIFDLTQSSHLQQVCANDVMGTQNGSASVTDYVFAANAAYRHDLTENSWFEPMAGLRYTITDFGSDVSNSVFTGNAPQVPQTPGRLGLEDGTALRLQFGGRYGQKWTTPEGYLWTTTLGAYLYSDVSITGFKSIAGQTGESVGPVDEGKIRALGQFETHLDVGNGLSYMLRADVRGGSDVFGVGGQLGIRYEW